MKRFFKSALKKIYYSPLLPSGLRRRIGIFYLLNFEFGAPYYASDLRPGMLRRALKVQQIIGFEYGHFNTLTQNSCVDAEGEPIPWYTYPAIEFLRQLDFAGKTVFEYGCGNSTLFWGKLARKVVSVESDAGWHAQVSAKVRENCEVILAPDEDSYVNAIERSGNGYDIIVVDGLSEHGERYRCAQAALRHLNDGGFVILDNSDYLPASSRLLRESNLIEVDMTGFGPINEFPWTTSFYFHRNFAFRPRHDRQPVVGTGGHPFNWEQDLPLGKDERPGVRR